MHHREEKRGIGAGSNEIDARSRAGGFGAARIDDDDFAAALDDALRRPGASGIVIRLPVRDSRIGADDEQVLGAIDIGNRNGGRKRAAEHQGGRNFFGKRVGGGGIENAAAAERSRQNREVEKRGVVHHRIAEVHADRIGAVFLPNRERREATSA